RRPLPPEALFDWDRMCGALAEQEPWWAPGTKHGYHAITFGFLIGEVIRRITGLRPRDYMRAQLETETGTETAPPFSVSPFCLLCASSRLLRWRTPPHPGPLPRGEREPITAAACLYARASSSA